MKKIFTIALLALTCVQAFAASSVLKEFTDKVNGSKVAFDYTYSLKNSKMKMTGSGKVTVQGDAFYMNGNGLEVWCDGKTSWVVDRESKEAVIETIVPSVADYFANPALLVVNVDKAFDEVSSVTGTFGGKSVRVSTLKPKADFDASIGGTSITSLKLYFAADKPVLVGAEAAVDDGTVTVFNISGMKFMEKESSLNDFRFNEQSLDSSYVITDLR